MLLRSGALGTWAGLRRGAVAAGAACVACLALAAGVAHAKPGTVTLKDGNSFSGDVTDKGEQVIVKTEKGEYGFKRAAVAKVTYGEAALAPAEELAARLAKLGPKDVDGRIELARSALEKKQYDIALDALDQALAVDPRNQEAEDLQVTVRNQRKLDLKTAASGKGTGKAGGAAGEAAGGKGEPPMKGEPASTGEEGGDPAGEAADPPPAKGSRAERPDPDAGETPAAGAPTRLVTDEEINRIRQIEWREGEKVTVRLQNDVKRRYLAGTDIRPAEFNRMSVPAQAREILDQGNPGMARDVVVVSDPPAMAAFKRDVHKTVLTGCAAANCHNSKDRAGGFMLHERAARDAETYTNFLILQQHGGGEGGRLIDRARPEDSLLLQYGLAPNVARVPHPEVQGYRGVYRGVSDSKYRAAMAWMQSLAAVEPDYGIDLSAEAPAGEGRRPARPAKADPADAEPAGAEPDEAEPGAEPADPEPKPAPARRGARRPGAGGDEGEAP